MVYYLAIRAILYHRNEEEWSLLTYCCDLRRTRRMNDPWNLGSAEGEKSPTLHLVRNLLLQMEARLRNIEIVHDIDGSGNKMHKQIGSSGVLFLSRKCFRFPQELF
jgi:hypothetical protein